MKREKAKAARLFKQASWILLLSAGLCSIAACDRLADRPIVVYGDSQSDEVAQGRVVAAIAHVNPAIIFRVGDIVDNGNDPAQWQAFRKIHEPLLKTTEYYPALGNHEQDSPLYFENFPRLDGQRWYSVERRGIHFTVLDSNSELKEGSRQYNWLEADLERVSPEIKFKIVILHHPLFNAGNHKEDENGLRTSLVPLFTKFGVGAVFSGHEHSYERFQYDGIYFIVTGGGGSHLVGQAKKGPYLQKFIKAYHFCVISAGIKYLQVRVFDVDSKLIDEFKIFVSSPTIP